MRDRLLIRLLLLLLVLICADSAESAAPPARMRPYSGIGVVILQDRGEPLHLYDEPGIFRLGELDTKNASGNESVFGVHKGSVPLIVVARKGTWLKVCYDDAGREAWIDTHHRGTLQPWDQFLKGQVSHLLPDLRRQYYRFFRLPGRDQLSALTAAQKFKVLKLDDDWAMVLSDQNTIGWLRWRDEDGRLLVGIAPDKK